MKKYLEKFIHNLEQKTENRGLTGIPTGFTKLDELTHGWQPSNLIVIGGRPAMGKTAFALSMVRNMVVDFNIPVAYFSLEMTEDGIITRIVSSETGIAPMKLRKGNIELYEWEIINNKLGKLEKAPLFIEDTAMLSTSNLRKKALNYVHKKGVKVLVIDYLQLITVDNHDEINFNKRKEISIIIRELKLLAKELNVPIVVLSQLTQTLELRKGSKRPILSDLRDWGDIEQYADVVGLLYRPEYYGMTEWDDYEHTPCEGEGEIIIAKNRNGSIDNIRLKFQGHLMKFSNLTKEERLEDNFTFEDDFPF